MNHVGWIRLNRPKVLNSLNLEMVELLYRKLQGWKDDPSISLVCMSGEGGKGFCAGGDMRSLYDLRESHVTETARSFFSTEYQLDLLIHSYPKPILVYMDGIVMGGGVGLAAGASHRIVTEKTKWAMPEMNIGFFPDVGASFFLNKMPGYTGRYLALTSEMIKAGDVIYSGGADYFIESNNWENIKADILLANWDNKLAGKELTILIEKYNRPTHQLSSPIAEYQEKINQHFSFDRMEDILSSLDNAASNGDQWSAETRKILLSKSPLSLKVTLSQLQHGKNKSLADCFRMEFDLSMNFMKNPDFYEGVRAVLVDKDRSPNWKRHDIS